MRCYSLLVMIPRRLKYMEERRLVPQVFFDLKMRSCEVVIELAEAKRALEVPAC